MKKKNEKKNPKKKGFNFKSISESEDIDYLETAIKCVELYQWLARHFDNNFFSFDVEKLLHNKSLAIEKLNQLLSEKISKKCSSCGVKLSEESKFNICETCFSQRRGRGSSNYRGKRNSGRSAKSNDKTGQSGNPGRKKSIKNDSSNKKVSSKKSKPKSKAAAFKRG